LSAAVQKDRQLDNAKHSTLSASSWQEKLQMNTIQRHEERGVNSEKGRLKRNMDSKRCVYPAYLVSSTQSHLRSLPLAACKDFRHTTKESMDWHHLATFHPR
jgi:hypothetical protein